MLSYIRAGTFILLGLVVFLFAVALHMRSPSHLSQDGTIAWETTRTIAGTKPVFMPIVINFKGVTTFPERVEPGEGFTVTLDLKLKSLLDGNGNKININDQEVRHKLKAYALHYTLELSGANVNPSKPIPVSYGDSAIWSVYPLKEGWLKGVIRPALKPIVRDSSMGKINNIQLIWPKAGELHVAIEVRSFWVLRLLKWIGLILGPLLALPGLYSFWKMVKKNSRKAENDKQKSKIILP